MDNRKGAFNKMHNKTPRIREINLNSSGPKDLPRSPRTCYTKGIINTQMKKRPVPLVAKKSPVATKKLQVFKPLPKISEAALQTPKSSKNVLVEHSPVDGKPIYKVLPAAGKDDKQLQVAVSGAEAPYFTLQRQHTAAMLNFRARKAVSQMDFKEARRTGNYQLVAHLPSMMMPATDDKEKQSNELANEQGLAKLRLQDAALLCNTGEGNVRFVISSDQDLRIASLRIFNAVMLRSWRRRREELRSISEQMYEYKRNFTNNRNQLHVYSCLYSTELRRNDALTDKLNQSLRECDKLKAKCEELSLSLEQQAKQHDLLARDKDDLQHLFTNVERELFTVRKEQREQLEELARTQREFQDLDLDKKELNTQLSLLQVELSLKEQHMDNIHENIAVIAEQLTLAGAKLHQYKHISEQCSGQLIELELQRLKINELEQLLQQKHEQLARLDSCLAATMAERIKHLFRQREAYNKATYGLLKFVATYMLPGNSPPTMPLSAFLDALGQLRGLVHARFRAVPKELK